MGLRRGYIGNQCVLPIGFFLHTDAELLAQARPRAVSHDQQRSVERPTRITFQA